MWNQAGTELLHEKDALLSLIKTLSDEKRISGSKGVLIVTPRYDVSLAILISALTNNNLLNEFLSLVTGFGDMEMLAISRNIQFKSSGLKAYENYYMENLNQFEKSLDFQIPQNLSKIIYMILENLLQGKPTYDNFHRYYARPASSTYTNKLLYNSQILEVRENYHSISIINQVKLYSEIITLNFHVFCIVTINR